MSDTCNTVKIKAEKTAGNDLGYIVINESDYDPDLHDLFVEEEPEAKEAKEGEAEHEPTIDEITAAKVREKETLIAKAAKLKLASPSVLERWSIARLTEAVEKTKD